MKRILTGFFSLFLALILSAQAPQAFKYQTVVRDAANAIMKNTDVYFRISILRGSSSGTEVYKETFSLRTNEFGLASFNIGQGSVVSGSFTTIDWSGYSYWVKVELDPDAAGSAPYENVGTSQLLSVPYALHAKSAETAGNAYWQKNVNDISYSSGKVGIGLSNPHYRLDVEGSNQYGVSSIKETSLPHTGVHESILHIQNNSNIASSQANISLAAGNPGHGRAIISATHDISAGLYNGNLTFKTRSGTTSYTNALTIRSSGNIGINEVNPSEKLHVNGNAYITGNLQVNGTTSGNLNLISPAVDLTGNGLLTSVTVDANATGIGAALFLASDGNYEEADADAAATMPCVALALETGTGNKKILLQGYIRRDTWTWTPGGLIYVSPATGALTQTIPSSAGQQVQIVGYATKSNTLFFNPNLMLIELK